ncbi:hypothetical protein [Methylomonas rivi]|uniref:Uncharacterized protein n=1 Tax=Methylomonas rivi TaxID=2952226 RepID=A0ABT1U4D0_9GAMM|nr:hypothetical protein [Methylomonas sp. WSC-6]MBS4049978.1 hypothetical protein [Methylomonas sp.]MCQ8128693.1 hypothetical protein [Methylomonas sp. WSC-6]
MNALTTRAPSHRIQANLNITSQQAVTKKVTIVAAIKPIDDPNNLAMHLVD